MLLLAKPELGKETDFKACFIGTLSDRDVALRVVDTKSNKVIDDFVTQSRNGKIDTSFPIRQKSIYRVRVASFGMLTHAFLIEMTPGRKVDMGRINAFLGDVNEDNVIDQRDLDLISRYREVKAGSDRWIFGDGKNKGDRAGGNCDFNGDNIIDQKDYKIAFDNVGKRGSLK